MTFQYLIDRPPVTSEVGKHVGMSNATFSSEGHVFSQALYKFRDEEVPDQL